MIPTFCIRLLVLCVALSMTTIVRVYAAASDSNPEYVVPAR